MDFFKKNVRFSLRGIFILAFVLIIILFSYFLLGTDPNPIESNLLAGLVTGFVIVLVQFCLSWYEFEKIEKLNRLQINDIRTTRALKSFYGDLIKNSRQKIYIMGVTANRFLEDFADQGSSLPESKVLFNILNRNVKVKIILPEKEFLETENQKNDFDRVKSSFEKIQEKYPNFEFKYFKHPPSHSIFIVDDECLLGPVFPNVSSKESPAIYLKNKSEYAQKYLDYFTSEWKIGSK